MNICERVMLWVRSWLPWKRRKEKCECECNRNNQKTGSNSLFKYISKLSLS